jgi:hypothetical protein
MIAHTIAPRIIPANTTARCCAIDAGLDIMVAKTPKEPFPLLRAPTLPE